MSRASISRASLDRRLYAVIFVMLLCPLSVALAQDRTQVNRDEPSVASAQAEQQAGSIDASSPTLYSAPGSTVSVHELSIPASARNAFEKAHHLLMDEHRAQESLAPLHKAVRIDPGYWEAQLLLGIAYMDLRKWSAAELSLNRVIADNEQIGAAYLALGSCLLEEGKYPEATQRLLKGLDLDPNAAHGHYDLSRTYYAMGRFDEARLQAQKAIEFGSPQADVRFLLGNILLRLGESRDALAEFQECLRLKPGAQLETLATDKAAQLQLQQTSAR